MDETPRNVALHGPRDFYLAGYAALDGGDYARAIALATQCLAIAPPDSYWHFGSLGLRCWAANYLGEDAGVERDAQALLVGDAGTEQPWFEGLALLNLGLVARRAGQLAEAGEQFARAGECYAAHRISPGQPAEWALVSQFFAAAACWAACGDADGLERLAADVAALPGPDEEMVRLGRAIDLYLRRARGEDVRAEAEAAVGEGVSRAFLALLLLECV